MEKANREVLLSPISKDPAVKPGARSNPPDEVCRLSLVPLVRARSEYRRTLVPRTTAGLSYFAP